MKIDECFAQEIKKTANGDGSREAKFAFCKKVREAARELSCPDVKEKFCDMIKKYGRVVVGLCVAATILDRSDSLSDNSVEWAREVWSKWTNRPPDPAVEIRDNLHFSRIEEPDYAGNFIKFTSK